METRSRRRFVSALAALWAMPALKPRAALAAEDAIKPLVDKITGGATVNSSRVHLEMPRLADNGHSVPLKLRIESPMTPADHVRRVTLLSGRNPRPLIATFHFSPHSRRAEIVTRVRMNGSQRVVALAEMSDGTYWSGTAEVEVTESACLDAT
jgi:sulfur-oxidizing protein SoxY